MTDLTGRAISSRYLVEKRLASGGMATVYLAKDLRLERKVAIKAIHPHLIGDQNFVVKFEREAKVAASLSHPNLVNVFDQGQDADVLYLVMEYVPGITLRDAIDQFGALTDERAFEVVTPIAAGLAQAHRAGILHRDIKPENILLADSGAVKLSDFGLAREMSNRTSVEELVGTAAYLSPELVSGGEVGPASDIYALGVVLFELVTSRQPFTGADSRSIALQHANSKIPEARTINPAVSSELSQLISWMTEKNANARISDGAALTDILRKLKGGQTVAELRAAGRPAQLHLATERIHIDSAAATTVLDLSPDSPNETKVIDLADEPEPGEVAKLPRPILRIIISAALAVLLGLGVGWYFGAGPGGLKTVPELTNRTVNEAQLALTELSPNLIVIEENSKDIAAGYIIRTEPSSGSLFFGGDLKLFVSTGPKLVAAPNLIGQNLASAQAKILAEGFAIGKISSFFNSAPLGEVFAHTGSDGKPIGESSAIDVSVSLGSIPSVAGLNRAAAELALTAVGIKIGKIREEYSDEIAQGNVISFIPQVEPLGENGAVDLVISKGPQLVQIPNLVGETILAAKSTLESIGLVVQVNTDQLSTRWGIVKVKRVSPVAGASVKIGSTVTISTR